MIQTISTDILVIGGGAAAATAALEAAKSDVTVTMMDKGRVGLSGSTPLSGAAFAPYIETVPQSANPVSDQTHDSPELFISDVLQNGRYMNDLELVQALADEGALAVNDALRIGVPFGLNSKGTINQRQAQGHSFPRVCQAVGGGRALMQALSQRLSEKSIKILERTVAIHLLQYKKRLTGIIAYDISTGKWLHVRCKAAVLAAGGAASLYRYSSGGNQATGDAMALALDAGCRLANMEFIEFTLIPTLEGRPIGMGGFGQFVARGAQLFNSNNKRFMSRYDPQRMELATKCLISRAVYEEIINDRGPIRLDLSQISQERWRDLCQKVPQLFKGRARIEGRQYFEKLCWTPGAHTVLGGIIVDTQCQTDVLGLFAAGECMNGIHGAERLAGNALLECLVFGRRAGQSAVNYASSTAISPSMDKLAIDKIASLTSRLGNCSSLKRLGDLRTRLQQIMWDTSGVVRDRSGLENGGKLLTELSKEFQDITSVNHHDLLKWLELKNLLTVGETVILAAKERTESRGAHQRRDFPDENDSEWFRLIMISKREGNFHIESFSLADGQRRDRG